MTTQAGAKKKVYRTSKMTIILTEKYGNGQFGNPWYDREDVAAMVKNRLDAQSMIDLKVGAVKATRPKKGKVQA